MISLRHRVLWASMLASATFASAGALAQAPVAVPAAPAAQSQPGAAEATPGKRMERGDPAKRFERMKEHRAKRMADLKAKLKLTPAQDGAWTSFSASTLPPSGSPPRRADRAELAKMTTPQRIERMQARQAERSAMFAKRADATKTFYAALNADQQKTFDAETARFGHGGHRGHGRHGHRHDGAEGHSAPPVPAKG